MKIGQKVQIVNKTFDIIGYCFNVGDIGTIVDMDIDEYGGTLCIRVLSNGIRQWVPLKDLVLLSVPKKLKIL
jgi:hypothetical protein